MKIITLGMLLVLTAVNVAGVAAVEPYPPAPGCEEYPPIQPHEPSGVKGCERYGIGDASRYPGSGVARNDCVYPWTACTPIQITSLETGISIIVTPTMFCDCYQRPGPNGETLRLVDLDPATVAALGLDWNDGMYDVSVEPATIVLLPDTRMSP
jgi:hypothetical protein